MIRIRPLIALAALSSCAALAPAHAQDAAGGDQPLCADRPGKVYATCAVDPGRLQLETDLINGTFQRQDGVTNDTWLVTNPTLKYGVVQGLDLQANLIPYEVVRTRDRSGAESVVGGIGDLYVRIKYAAVGGSDAKLTVSVLPYVKLPTARDGIGNGAVEGGAAVAIGYKLDDAWSLAFSPELDGFADQEGTGRHLNHVEVISLSRSLPHDVTVSGELWGDWNYEPSRTTRQYSADLSAAWAVTRNLQLDGGLNVGLNSQTPGFQAYVGLAQRF